MPRFVGDATHKLGAGSKELGASTPRRLALQLAQCGGDGPPRDN